MPDCSLRKEHSLAVRDSDGGVHGPPCRTCMYHDDIIQQQACSSVNHHLKAVQSTAMVASLNPASQNLSAKLWSRSITILFDFCEAGCLNTISIEHLTAHGSKTWEVTSCMFTLHSTTLALSEHVGSVPSSQMLTKNIYILWLIFSLNSTVLLPITTDIIGYPFVVKAKRLRGISRWAWQLACIVWGKQMMGHWRQLETKGHNEAGSKQVLRVSCGGAAPGCVRHS